MKKICKQTCLLLEDTTTRHIVLANSVTYLSIPNVCVPPLPGMMTSKLVDGYGVDQPWVVNPIRWDNTLVVQGYHLRNNCKSNQK